MWLILLLWVTFINKHKVLQWTWSQKLPKLYLSHVSCFEKRITLKSTFKYTTFEKAHPFGILIDLHSSTGMHSTLHFLNFWSHFCQPLHFSCFIMHRPYWNQYVLWRSSYLKTIAERFNLIRTIFSEWLNHHSHVTHLNKAQVLHLGLLREEWEREPNWDVKQSHMHDLTTHVCNVIVCGTHSNTTTDVTSWLLMSYSG